MKKKDVQNNKQMTIKHKYTYFKIFSLINMLIFVPLAEAKSHFSGSELKRDFTVLRGAFRAKEGSNVVECRLENLSRISGEAGGDLLAKSIKPCEGDELKNLIADATSGGGLTKMAKLKHVMLTLI